jgi:hypothetical protein
MTRIPTAENATIHKTVVADTTGSPSAAGASLVSVSYTNLVNFSSENPSSSQQSLIDAIGDAFGADGLGILLVTDVPDFEEQRRLLLPLAAQLPYVDDLERCVHPESLYSTGWSHGKECLQQQIADGDGSTTVVVPDTSKGSFYANPLTNDLTASCMARDRDRRDKGSPGDDEARDQHWKSLAQAHPEFFAANLWPTNSMPQLELAFMTMGRTIHRVGCLLAAACDAYCHQQSSGVVELKLQETLQRSLNAKGRLLHYFEVSSNNERGDNAKTASNEMSETMWCGWHNDHGTYAAKVHQRACRALMLLLLLTRHLHYSHHLLASTQAHSPASSPPCTFGARMARNCLVVQIPTPASTYSHEPVNW